MASNPVGTLHSQFATSSVPFVGAIIDRPRALNKHPYNLGSAHLPPLSLRGGQCPLTERAPDCAYCYFPVLLRYPAASLPLKRLRHLPTAATRSGRFIRHRRRSHRSPLSLRGLQSKPWQSQPNTVGRGLAPAAKSGTAHRPFPTGVNFRSPGKCMKTCKNTNTRWRICKKLEKTGFVKVLHEIPQG